MYKIALFGKALSDNNCIYLQEIINFLEKENCQIFIYENFMGIIHQKISFNTPPILYNHHKDLINHQIDYLFSIGGDGTLLDTITLIKDSEIPILGINLGRLGFLSSVSKQQVSKALEDVLNKKYVIDKRTLLRLETNNNLFKGENFALNDFTITGVGNQSMLNITVDINNHYLNTYWGDGVIVSTPTGSTAYSMSSGGPIIAPKSETFVITPIASHNLTVRPFVISDQSTIKLRVTGRVKNYNISLDARRKSLDTPIDLIVTKEKFKIYLIELQEEHFFTTIRNKLNWGLDNRN